MDVNAVIGICATFGITVVGFMWTYGDRIKKDTQERIKEMQRNTQVTNNLNESIIKLTISMENILKMNDVRDKIIEQHNREIGVNKESIHKVNERVQHLEKTSSECHYELKNIKDNINRYHKD